MSIKLIKPISQVVKQRPEFHARYAGMEDEFGFDVETVERWQPLWQFLYEGWFEATALGIENIPSEGRAVLVGNHSGVLPIDAFLLHTALLLNHPHPRRIRFLSHKCLLTNKFVRNLVKGVGGVPARYSTATKLLRSGELVFFYPEGARGTGKPFSMRYRLHDFDPGFVKAAIECQAPIVPIATIGGDEIFMNLGNLKPISRLMGTPYWPYSPTFPWLPFFASGIPMPIKILIKVGKPIHLNLPPDKVSDRKLRLEIARDIQFQIQNELNALLRIRKSPFSPWNKDLVAKLPI